MYSFEARYTPMYLFVEGTADWSIGPGPCQSQIVALPSWHLPDRARAQLPTLVLKNGASGIKVSNGHDFDMALPLVLERLNV
jgi:hypothetical protein